MSQTTEAPPQGEPNHAPHEAVDLAQTPAGRTVRRIGHGGVFVPADPDDAAEPHESTATLMPRTEAAVRRDLREQRFDATTSFDYLLSGVAASYPEGHLPVGGGRLDATRDALMRLGAAMIEPAAAPGSARRHGPRRLHVLGPVHRPRHHAQHERARRRLRPGR